MEAVSFQKTSPQMFMNYPSLGLNDGGTWLIKVITINKLAPLGCHEGMLLHTMLVESNTPFQVRSIVSS